MFRSSAAIIVAYIASTLLVIVWLVFTIEITLKENEEDANGVATPGRTAELIKVVTLLTDWLMWPALADLYHSGAAMHKGYQGTEDVAPRAPLVPIAA